MYFFLIIYWCLHVLVIRHQRPVSRRAIGWLVSSLAMYVVYIFWFYQADYALFLYVAISVYVVFSESRWILVPFCLMNIINCVIVITHVGGEGYVPFSSFFVFEYNEASIILDELNGMGMFFLIWVVAPSLFFYGLFRLMDSRK